MDEHRIGLKPIVGRVWAKRGKAPTVPVQHRYQWLYLYAFARPQTGEGQYWLLPSVNTEVFQTRVSRHWEDGVLDGLQVSRIQEKSGPDAFQADLGCLELSVFPGHS